MSAQEIPDLRTLLARRGGPGRTRGSARGRGSGTSSHAGSEALRDNAVRGTDQDAVGSRLSCVDMGYLHDPYAALFAKQPAARRLPLLNRGTYVRTSAIDQLIDRFLTTSPSSPKQIISLGAGTDTRYFRLRDLYPDTPLVYHELDFPANTSAKLSSIQRHAQLYTKLTPNSPPNPLGLESAATTYTSPTYNIHALDLRSLATSADTPPPHLPNLDPTLPTLILSEMCLIYLDPQTVSSILRTITQTYIPSPTPLSLILYEPILPHDAFGQTMISNLSSRNIHLPTFATYPNLASQRARLTTYGFADGANAADTLWLWKHCVAEEEKERVADLEMLDELEELELLLRHYCVAWGWRDGGEGMFSTAWGDVKEQVGG